jgi:hypothetical protein
MLARPLLVLSFLLAFTLCASAQSTCKCEDHGSGAMASCSPGSIALCSCTSNGCSSRCVKPVLTPFKLPDINAFVTTLKQTAPADINDYLSKTLGKTVTFETPIKDFKFDYPPSKISKNTTHWDVLDALAAKGNLRIDDHDIDFWKAQRDYLLGGGAITISTGGGTVQSVLNNLAFITGKNFTVRSGDASSMISEIKGSGLSELLQNLSKAGKVTITEN